MASRPHHKEGNYSRLTKRHDNAVKQMINPLKQGVQPALPEVDVHPVRVAYTPQRQKQQENKYQQPWAVRFGYGVRQLESQHSSQINHQ